MPQQALGLQRGEAAVGAFAQRAVEQQDARRMRRAGNVRDRGRAQAVGRQVRQVGDHARASCGVAAGNQRRPSHRAALTRRISTGTSTSGPMTAAKATGEASPKAAMATAIASSKLLEAAVKARAVVRG